MQWVSVRTKYWLVALMRPVSAGVGGTFHGLVMRGDTAVGKIKRTASATTSIPLTNGQIAFDIYAGPQSWEELHALGNDLENVNPYAGFMHARRAAVRDDRDAGAAVDEEHVPRELRVGARDLRRRDSPRALAANQKAMRTSIAMQRLQPELQEIQKKYKNEPDKQRDALVKLYSSHGMSPLSPMLGCLPMLLPMPVLFALYFVFQNTIEFRGVLVPVAAGHLAARSVLHHAGRDGRVDVRAVVDRHAWHAAESADEDDELHDAGDVHGHVPQLRLGPEPVLRGAEHRRRCRSSGCSRGSAPRRRVEHAVLQRRHRAEAASGRAEGAEGRKRSGHVARGDWRASPRASRTDDESHVHRPRDAAARTGRRDDSHRSELRPEARPNSAARFAARHRAREAPDSSTRFCSRTRTPTICRSIRSSGCRTTFRSSRRRWSRSGCADSATVTPSISRRAKRRDVGEVTIHAASATHRGNRYGYDRWRSAANMYLLDAGEIDLLRRRHGARRRHAPSRRATSLEERSRAGSRAAADRVRAVVEAGVSKGTSHARRCARRCSSDFARACFVPYHWGTFRHVTSTAHDAIDRLRERLESTPSERRGAHHRTRRVARATVDRRASA